MGVMQFTRHGGKYPIRIPPRDVGSETPTLLRENRSATVFNCHTLRVFSHDSRYYVVANDDRTDPILLLLTDALEVIVARRAVPHVEQIEARTSRQSNRSTLWRETMSRARAANER